MNKTTTRQKDRGRNFFLIWVVGLAGQLCWNTENVWFNTFVYDTVGPKSWVVNVMVAVSALATTFSTFYFGTLSDRAGKRKPFVVIGYILWGILTIAFGAQGYLTSVWPIWALATSIIFADAIMSFFGSMGNDSGFNAWTADLINENNQGLIGGILAALPVIGTIIGTIVGGILIEAFGYMVFFSIIGGLVILVGLLSLVLMKDKEDLVPNKQGTFWQQFGQAFSFKKLKEHKELLLVFITSAIFFVGFNVFYVHIGNLLIYNYGFDEGSSGIIQGAGMVIALLFAFPTAKAINKRKSPKLLLIAIILSVVSLIYLGFVGPYHDASNLWSVKNLPLLFGVIVMAIGYIMFMQTSSVWVKALYPEGKTGQFEGLRIVFFVLIPMILGGVISEPLIQIFGNPIILEAGTTGVLIDGFAPTEALFFGGAVVMALAIIPLIKLRKTHDDRINGEYIAGLKEVETEITEKNTLIFDEKGNHINAGYARRYNFLYRRADVKKKGRLKEWDFYQINNDRYVVQLTLGHISYAQNGALTLIDLVKGTTKTVDVLKLFKGKSLMLSEDPNVNQEAWLADENFELTFRKTNKTRELYGNATDKEGLKWQCYFQLDELPEHDALVINTPFDKSKKHFYLNYKINNLIASGFIQIGDEKITFKEKDSFGVLDWGRGVWPYHENWYWGSLSAKLKDGRHIGLNTGYGFGNLTEAGENMLFIDGKAYKLKRMYQQTPMELNYMAPIILKDENETIELKLDPIYDRFTNTDFKLIYMKCHQIHGYYTGTIKLETGEIVNLNHLLGFYEHSHNKW